MATAGSSPLARGLPCLVLLPLLPQGIIPARAGFTPRVRTRPRRPRDHPRSRGVYLRYWHRAFTNEGSSPLARGLRRHHGSHPGADGIIPARAGFTSSEPSPCSVRPDHPRSRGVYRDTVVPAPAERGSSPLARGLPPRRGVYASFRRIIPARAGFTTSSSERNHHARDHPRSRGVYSLWIGQVRGFFGSSPLARGLLHGGPVAIGQVRIIPARAGFTHPPRAPPHPHSDHPRSRGVYSSQLSGSTIMRGSSPLARGLRRTGRGRRRLHGIIPARAGFTEEVEAILVEQADHPRSRGVYLWDRRARDHDPGSSPLARGLRPVGARHGREAGIIPARAGFTLRATSQASTCPDHPRSRGVYPADETLGGPVLGSSPLARGLLAVIGRHSVRVGIIPARAGFTWRCSCSVPGTWDHPRSRGVYPAAGAPRSAGWGSSPLARGLLAAGVLCEHTAGIIPARAGFTAGHTCRVIPSGDHPRSRGVYGAGLPLTVDKLGSSPLARGLPPPPRRHRPGRRIIPARAGFTA